MYSYRNTIVFIFVEGPTILYVLQTSTIMQPPSVSQLSSTVDSLNHKTSSSTSQNSLSSVPLSILQTIYHQQSQQYHEFLTKQCQLPYDISIKNFNQLDLQFTESSKTIHNNNYHPHGQYVPQYIVPSPLPPIETDDHRIQQRYRQILMGKNSLAYYRYRTNSALLLSTNSNPDIYHHQRSKSTSIIPNTSNPLKNSSSPIITPNPLLLHNKRQWDSEVKRWRRCLHDYDVYTDIQLLHYHDNDTNNRETKRSRMDNNTNINNSSIHSTTIIHPSSHKEKLGNFTVGHTSNTSIEPINNENDDESNMKVPITTLPNGQMVVNDLPITAWDIPYLLYTTNNNRYVENNVRSKQQQNIPSSLSSLENYLHNTISLNTVLNNNKNIGDQIELDNSYSLQNDRSTLSESPTYWKPSSLLRIPNNYSHPLMLSTGPLINNTMIGDQLIDELYLITQWKQDYERLHQYLYDTRRTMITSSTSSVNHPHNSSSSNIKGISKNPSTTSSSEGYMDPSIIMDNLRRTMIIPSTYKFARKNKLWKYMQHETNLI